MRVLGSAMKRGSNHAKRRRKVPRYEELIKTLCSHHRLSRSVTARALEIARKFFKGGGGGSRLMKLVVLGSIYLAALEEYPHRDLMELATSLSRKLELENVSVLSAVNTIARRLGVDLRHVARAGSIRVGRAVTLIHKACEGALDPDTRAKAFEHLQEVAERVPSASPRTLAALAIAKAVVERSKQRGKEVDIGEALRLAQRVTGVTLATLRRWLRIIGYEWLS